MKPIVDYVKACELSQKPVSLGSEVALASGFTMAAKKSKAVERGYIVIKEHRIYDYLEGLVREDLKAGERISYVSKHQRGSQLTAEGVLKGVPFCMFRSNYRYSTKCFAWCETLVGDYQEIPPAYVYRKLLEAKEHNIFDCYTVAVIREVKDPLLLGRINNDDNRYFIAQWDDDIQLDNLI